MIASKSAIKTGAIFLLLIICMIGLIIAARSFARKKGEAVLVSLSHLKNRDDVKVVSPYQVLINSETNTTIEVPLPEELNKAHTNTLWVRAHVKSNRYRTGVHFSNSNKEFYSYHSGDGTWQLLIREIKINSDKSKNVLRIISSETNDKNGDVIVGPIILSKPGADINYLGLPGISTNSWARDNNPNKDFWFDRYVSQTNDFAVTIPHPKNTIWEHYFGIGVNDRFSTGDYFCYPDDKILLRNIRNGEIKWIYLGGLPWKKNLEINNNILTTTFAYHGPVMLGEHMEQEHARKLLRQFWPDGIDMPEDTQLDLSKKYVFKTGQDFADVYLKGTIKTSDIYTSTWIIEDTAYMDFNINNPLDIRSYLNGQDNIGGYIYQQEGSSTKLPTFDGYLYRLRNQRKNLAVRYISSQSNLWFMIPNVLTEYISSNKKSFFKYPNTFAKTQRPNREKGEYWSLGTGFNFDRKGLIDTKYKMQFISGFDKPESIPFSATKALENRL